MTEKPTEFVLVTIDDRQIQVPKGTTVYMATKMLGIDVPIFCYQDRMPPFGACRVCLVEVEKMAKPQTSCTLEALDGMVVRTQAHAAVQARDEILEFLLINHPLDCPICDRGGECPLQDQAYKFGPGKSRFFEDKRRFEKPIYLGPVLTLDRERCIACARCTRFGDIIAGDHGLEFIDRGYKSEVGTIDGGAPKSKFIGNTIMICPVGALTSTVYRFRARPWDNASTKTTCPLCPVGCSMILDSRDGEIMRTRSDENRAVNDIWLCDKGWFGYEFSSSNERLTQPHIKRHDTLEPVSWDEAFAFVASKMREAKSTKKAAAVGGNNLTVEENYLLQKLMRDVLGSPHVDHRVGMPSFPEDDEGLLPGMEIEIGDTEELSRVLLLGIDLTEEFPVIWLRLKQAINKGARLQFFGHFAPEIARYIEKTTLHTPGDELETVRAHKDDLIRFLQEGEKAAIFIGSQYLNTSSRKSLLAELLTWKKAIPHLSLNLLEGRDNSMGARFAGMYPAKTGYSALKIVETAAAEGWDFLYAVGCNLVEHLPSLLWEKARKQLGCLVVQDIFLTETAKQADVVLPTACFVEKGGSFLNIEGRVQKLRPGKALPKGVYCDSYIFVRLAQRLQYVLMIDEPFLDKLKEGQRVAISRPEMIDAAAEQKSSRENTLVATFAHALFDRGVRMRHNTQLVQLAKEARIRIHPAEAAERGLADGEEVVIHDNHRFISTKVQVDERVAKRTVVIPVGFDVGFNSLPAHEFGANLFNGMRLEIQKR